MGGRRPVTGAPQVVTPRCAQTAANVPRAWGWSLLLNGRGALVSPRRNVRGLTWRPVTPGSDQHLAMLAKAQVMGRILYPGLYERRDAQMRAEAARRACAVIAAAAARVNTKQNAPELASEAFTAPRSNASGIEDGCSTECA
jgi:hypothetical protein